MTRKDRRIVPISKLTGFRVAPGDPDPRGWDVIAADGHTVGVVRDLLVDREVMKVRYLEVELAAGGRRTLLPVGTALLDDATDRVLFHELAPRQLAQLPEYDYDTFSREYETSVLTRFGAGGGGTVSAGSWSYDSRHFDDDAFFRRRNRYAGMARGERLDHKLTRSDEEIVLSRRVVGPADALRAPQPAAPQPAAAQPAAAQPATSQPPAAQPPAAQPEAALPAPEPAPEPAPKKRSRRTARSAAGSASAPAASAEPRPTARSTTRASKRGARKSGATPAAPDAVASTGVDPTAVRETAEEIVVPIVEEELVVERRPVVKEELVIRKKAVRETRSVEADLRKERLDVARRTTRDPETGGP